MNKIKIHTVDQPDSDITTFIISCNRLDLLSQTLESFHKTNNYITKMVILDDSADPNVFEILVNTYGHYCDIICFPNNRGLWWALDFMTSYCETEYIFYLEDDWEFINSGYIEESKKILEKYREVGIVDISQRTFEFQGVDSFQRDLIDECFYWKKPWKLTDHHFAWHLWCGSPNLKRRDDMIMLGKLEKWHTEHNIDRKFTSLGFKGVFTKNKYVEHLGDNRSRMVDKRIAESNIPYDYYPVEILKNRTKPKMNYYELDQIYDYPGDVTLVTCLLDLNRDDRSFEEHYLSGIESLLSVRYPLLVFSPQEYHETLTSKRKNLSIATSDNKIYLEFLNLDIIKKLSFNAPIQEIIQSTIWQEQSSWIKGSVICSDHYILLTLYKLFMLKEACIKNPANSKRFYWIDSGITNSFQIREPLTEFDFLKLPKNNKIFLGSFPYNIENTESEMHGYNINKMSEYIGKKPEYVCRATLFGGTQEAIINLFNKYEEVINDSISMGCIGTEESIFTIIENKYPELFDVYPMPNGDVKNILNLIKK